MTDSPLTTSGVGSFNWRRNLVWWSEVILIGVLGIISVPLARRNLRRGRSDPAGALRLGMFVLALRGISWLLLASHATSLRPELMLIALMLAGALTEAGLLYLFYLALEPYVRRLWPQTLIPWAKVLQGKLSDPAVARDIFLGCLLGGVLALMFRMDFVLTTLFNLQTRAPVRAEDFYVALAGLRTALGFCCDALRHSIYLALLFMLLIVLLRTYLKSTIAATILCGIIISLLFIPRGAHPVFSLVLIGAGCVAVTVWALSRLGMLAVATTLLLAIVLTRFPLTFDTRVWYSDLSLLILLLAAGAAVGSFVLTRRKSQTIHSRAETAVSLRTAP